MSELTTDLKSLHEATLNNLKSSKANNTLRAYKSDFKDFGAFCAKHGFNSLPSEPKTVSLYLTHLSKNFKISTLRRRLVSISMVHKLKGHYLDTKHPIIVENLMGIKRVKGSIQKGKKPILINHLKLIIKDCLKVAGIENRNFSGHSLRSGFATVAAESGADERSIMAMTGHKTTQMVRRYIREANIFKNNALNKIKI